MKIYIHRETGVATAALADSTSLQTINGVLGSTLHVDCVFHDGSQAIELASGSIGALVAKEDKQYTAAAVVAATSWTKADAVEDGYRITLLPASDGLKALLANLASVALMTQIAWTEGGEERKTQVFNLVVSNAVYRDDEPAIEQPDAVWPLPGELARLSDLSGFSGDIVVGDKTLTFSNGLIKSIA